MNIGLIDIGWKKLSIDSLEKEALGGSESWLLQVANELAKENKVDVYCETDTEITRGNLTFIPIQTIIPKFCNYPHYDFMILNRIVHRYNCDIIGLIRQYNVTDNIYIQMHDLSLQYEDHLITEQEFFSSCINDPRMRGFVLLTPWHARNFLGQYPWVDESKINLIPNGVDRSLFSNEEKKKDHRILWSSCAERGLDILINDIYPLVRAKIKDFGVDVAGYNNISNLPVLADVNNRGKDIRLLGNLDKKTLYKEMNKHCVWFYPGIFAETFCITMVENVLNRNIVVSPFTYGTYNILNNELTNKIKMAHTFFQKDSDEYKRACQEAASKIVDAINNYDNYKEQIEQAYIHCCLYTWGNTANSYISIYKRDTYQYPIKHELKGLFLSQSCNHEFFKKESELVEQTWAKDLIDGKYPGYEYFRYTSCDEEHPEPCIDGHIIYVNNDDSLPRTYEKLRDAYRLLLKEGYSFKNFFRTNTSTFVNVPKVIEILEKTDDNTIVSDICGYYHKLPDGTLIFQFNTFIGNGYIMSKKMADRIYTSNYTSEISTAHDGDDIVSALVMREMINPWEVMYDYLNFDSDGNHVLCRRYKFKDPELLKDEPEELKRWSDDPSIAKQYATISYRIGSVPIENRIKMGEYEHLKELYEAYVS